MKRVVVAASGKYLIAFLPSRKEVAVVDVAAKTIVKTLPVDDEDVLIAAGETRLVVLERGKGVISRYKLATWERELAVACEPYTSLAMGSSSEGPLVALGTGATIIDLTTLKPTDSIMSGHLQVPGNLQASANGQVFGNWHSSYSPSGLMVLSIVDGKLRGNYEHSSVGAIMPGPDGRVIYTAAGRFGPNCEHFDDIPRGNVSQVLLPAASGPFYLTLSYDAIANFRNPAPLRLTVHCQNDRAPLLTVADATLPDIPRNIHPAQMTALALQQRLFLLPVADALVSVPSTSDQFLIQPFNVQEELDKAGTDYFFVSSMSPTVLQRGKKLSYQIEVLSKQGKVQYSLESAPPGMSVSPQGLLTWDVPADFSADNAAATIKVRDGSGQEILHAVRLSEEQPQSQPIVMRRAPTPLANVPRPPAQNVPPAVASAATLPTPPPPTVPSLPPALPVPTNVGDNQWRWSGPESVAVRDERGNIGGILSGNKLFLLDENGAPSAEAVTLPTSYAYAGLRKDQIIGVATSPTRVEILDRSGKELRRVSLGSDTPTGFVLHPSKPVCYVSLDRGRRTARHVRRGGRNSGDR